MVFFFHFNPFRGAPATDPLRFEAHLFLTQWNAGVPLFFVLSGFLIAVRYRHSVEPSWGWARRYLQNRVARIYPVYLLLTLATLGLWEFAGSPFEVAEAWGPLRLLDKLTVLLLNLTLLRAYFNELLYVGVLTAWSLTVEETFYLTAPFVLWSIRGRWWPLVAVAVGMPAVGLALVQLLPHPYGLMDSFGFMARFTYFGHAAEFMAGVGLAVWVEHRPHLPRLRLPLTATAAACFVVVLLIGGHCSNGSATRFVFGLGVAASVCALFYGLLSERTYLRAFLESKLMQELGKSSYVFYLLHVGVFMTALDLVGVTNLFARFVATTLASLALYYGVEHPLHLRLRAKRAKKQANKLLVPA